MAIFGQRWFTSGMSYPTIWRQAHHPKRNSPFSQKSAIKSILLEMSREWSMNSSSIHQLSTKSIHQLSCLQLFYSSDDSTRNSCSSFIIMFPKSSICKYTSFSDRPIWLYMIISIIYIYMYIYIYYIQCQGGGHESFRFALQNQAAWSQNHDPVAMAVA